MVTLATSNEKAFVPSTLEAPTEFGQAAARVKGKKDFDYTIDSVRRLKSQIKKTDKLFLLIGMDAFADIASWHEAVALLAECEFIIASRPGHSLADVAEALPVSLRPKAAIVEPFKKHAASGELRLRGVNIQLLPNVHQNVSATAIRETAKAGKPLGKTVSPAVADYIRKTDLYRRG